MRANENMIQFIEFTPDPASTSVYGTPGTAKVRINKEVGEVKAYDEGERVTFYGLAIKYRTGTKVWHGEAIYWKSSGNINNLRGGLDNRQRERACELVGFYEDTRDKDRSQHVGA